MEMLKKSIPPMAVGSDNPKSSVMTSEGRKVEMKSPYDHRSSPSKSHSIKFYLSACKTCQISLTHSSSCFEVAVAEGDVWPPGVSPFSLGPPAGWSPFSESLILSEIQFRPSRPQLSPLFSSS